MARAVTGAHRREAGAGVFVLPTPSELARAVAGRLWGIARERTGPGPVHIALSGGETPRKAYETLAAEPYRGRLPWGSVHFWQTDERFVPAPDPRSNRRMIGEALLSRAPVPRENFHGIDTSLPGPGEAARAYEAEIRRTFPAVPGEVPRFDAAVLGIGADGHTASLFPGSPALAEEFALVLPVEGDDTPVSRVTVTLPLLNAALRVVFILQGKGKANVLRDVVAAFRDPSLRSPGLPATLVTPPRGTVMFLADADAASLLPAEWRFPG